MASPPHSAIGVSSARMRRILASSTRLRRLTTAPCAPYRSDARWSIPQAVPAQTPCAHCTKVGFVRREHVITGAASHILYYCGRCNHSWSIAERDELPGKKRRIVTLQADPPDRSRPW